MNRHALSCALLGALFLLAQPDPAHAAPDPSPAPAAPVAVPSAAPAASPSPAAPPPATKAPARPRGWYFDLDSRLQIESYDYFKPAANGFQNGYTFTGLRIRPAVGYDAADWQVRVQPQIVTLFDLPPHSVAPAPLGALGQGGTYYATVLRPGITTLGVRQGYVRIGKSAAASNVQIGRFDYNGGMEAPSTNPTLDFLKRTVVSRAVIASPEYNTWGRSYDGVRADLEMDGIRLTGSVFKPTQVEAHFSTQIRNIVDEHAALTFEDKLLKNAEVQLFFDHQQDTRPVPEIDDRPAPMKLGTIQSQGGNSIYTYGLHFVTMLGRDGDAALWYAKQSGHWGKQTHDASGYIASLGLHLNDVPWKPWFRVGYYSFSGDPVPTDNKHQTFMSDFQLPPPLRYNMYTYSNMHDVLATIMVNPRPQTTLRFDWHSLSLDKSADYWYGGIGAAQERGVNGMSGRPSGGANHIGNLVEFAVENKFDKNNYMAVRYIQALGGSVVRNNFPAQTDGHLFLIEYKYMIP